MVKIRLTRLGKHNAPFYRVVVVDSRDKRDGAYLELLGTFNPILKNTKNPSEKINFKTERLIVWLNKGAQPTETVLNFLKQKGIWKAYLDSKKKPAKKKAKRKLSAKRKLVKKEKKHRPKKAKKPVPNQLPPSESSNQ